jgi:hypothetical protein
MYSSTASLEKMSYEKKGDEKGKEASNTMGKSEQQHERENRYYLSYMTSTNLFAFSFLVEGCEN